MTIKVYHFPGHRQFVQKFIQAYNKETIKALHYWAFVLWICYQNSGFLVQKASNAESVFMLWGHHVYILPSNLQYKSHLW